MRRQFSFTLVVPVAVILLLALGAPLAIEVETVPLSWSQASPTDGEVLYANLCASCHGPNAKGGGPAAPALATPVPDLTLLSASNNGVFPRPELWRTIAGGSVGVPHETRVMPAWEATLEGERPDWKPARRGAFARERIEALVQHLEGLQIAAPRSDEG